MKLELVWVYNIVIVQLKHENYSTLILDSFWREMMLYYSTSSHNENAEVNK